MSTAAGTATLLSSPIMSAPYGPSPSGARTSTVRSGGTSFPRDTRDLQEFELPLRVGLIPDTTFVATRLIYAGVVERHSDCRRDISQLPST